jgi:hypothetical protein
LVRIALIEHGVQSPNETVVQQIQDAPADRLFTYTVRETLNLSPTLWRFYRLVCNAPSHTIPAEKVFAAFGVRPAMFHRRRGWLGACVSRISAKLRKANIPLAMRLRTIQGRLTVRLVRRGE